MIVVVGEFLAEGTINTNLLAHEYFHVLQGKLSNHSRLATPRWLFEGSAVYEAMVYLGVWERYRLGALLRSANYDAGLKDLERFERLEAPHAYGLGALGSEWLAQQAGGNSQVKYWQSLGGSATWGAAFESAFGVAADEFYEAFEAHFERTLSELPIARLAGTVLGPGREPLQGIVVVAQGTDYYNTSSIETGRDGTFNLHVHDGPIELKIYARPAGIWRHVGWYGEGGLATDRSQVTTIEVDGADVTGIGIRLPADPTDLPEARIPRVRGTALGPDGEPAAGVGVWVWGGSTDNSKFGGVSSDGTFDLDHQNGTFTLRVYSLEDGVWRHIGWYGEGGFTADRDSATVIEVDGADATGIEIRLPADPADPADLPTVR